MEGRKQRRWHKPHELQMKLASRGERKATEVEGKRLLRNNSRSTVVDEVSSRADACEGREGGGSITVEQALETS